MDGFEHCSNLSDFDTPCESGNSPLVVQCERGIVTKINKYHLITLMSLVFYSMFNLKRFNE